MRANNRSASHTSTFISHVIPFETSSIAPSGNLNRQQNEGRLAAAARGMISLSAAIHSEALFERLSGASRVAKARGNPNANLLFGQIVRRLRSVLDALKCDAFIDARMQKWRSGASELDGRPSQFSDLGVALSRVTHARCRTTESTIRTSKPHRVCVTAYSLTEGVGDSPR